MSNFQPPKGMKDLDSVEMKKRKWIYERVRGVVEKSGYDEIEPVAVEYYETLAAKAGEDNLGEVYSFEDKGGRKLGLRFDLTVGITRMIAGLRESAPIKLYCISNMWRYDKPQKGRYRCFYQWDIECFGTDCFEADAEIIKTSIELMKKLGLDVEIRINNRKIIEGILNYLGIVEKEQLGGAMRTIDKIDKLGRAALMKEFLSYDITDMQGAEILCALKRKGDPKKVFNGLLKDFPSENEVLEQGLAELKGLISVLEDYDILENCVLDLSIVRGIAYYTGTVIEAYDTADLSLGAIFAGGRFDKLCGQYGADMPAIGIAGGIERLIVSLDARKLMPDFSEKNGIYVVSVNDKVKGDIRRIAGKLRSKKKCLVEYDICNRNFSKQMKYANKKGYKYVVVIGDKEVKSGEAKIKDMKNGKEEKIKF